ncbi:MAG: hypothetical protein BAJATHORv1_20637 [Candidatus Thorarchaeota archaeon]|nr:MAG: hypothetical protein BAJATHORv1_20637 [Candidatus Thorarchaeota archaeon]
MVTAESLIQEIAQYYEILEPVSESGFSVYPLIGSSSTPIISLKEAQTQGLSWVQESSVESVEQLDAINKGDVPVLIPYLSQVQGGKQDRTVFEPVIVPTGHDESNPLSIPAKCIEMSRWHYGGSRGEKTTREFSWGKSRVSSQMAHSISLHHEQGIVWENVDAAQMSMGFSSSDAPTSSYREMNETAFETREDLKKMLETLMEGTQNQDQVGVVVVYKGRLLGIESYGSSNLWNQFSEEVLRGFIIDMYFLKSEEEEEEDELSPPDVLLSNLNEELKETGLIAQKASGVGDLYRFRNDSWEGVFILHDGVPIHLYASKKHVDTIADRRVQQSRSQRRDFRVTPVSSMMPEQRIMPTDEIAEEDILEEEDSSQISNH